MPQHATPTAVDPRTGDLSDDVPVLDRFRLDQRVAIITGASSGLGAGFAKALASTGAIVVLAARRREKLEALAQQITDTAGQATTFEADVSDPEVCAELACTVMETHGRVDVLVNNAGLGTAVPALKETPDQFRSVVDVNLNGAYWMAKMRRRNAA